MKVFLIAFGKTYLNLTAPSTSSQTRRKDEPPLIGQGSVPTNGQTTADESLILRAGVCRDFAHLGIAFCRALGIPARFVSCYAYGLEPRDFHAVFEAFLDGRWWLFDATRQANLDGLVRIGVGRDAAEIAFSSMFGEVEAGPVKITIEHADGSQEQPGRTTEAISTEEPAPNAGAN